MRVGSEVNSKFLAEKVNTSMIGTLPSDEVGWDCSPVNVWIIHEELFQEVTTASMVREVSNQIDQQILNQLAEAMGVKPQSDLKVTR